MVQIWSWLGIVAAGGVVAFIWSLMVGCLYFMAREGIDNRNYRLKVHSHQLSRYVSGEIAVPKDGTVPVKVTRNYR